MKKALILLSILCTILPVSLTAATIRVPADHPTIQAGIDAAVNGDIVLVTDGTYTGAGNKNLDFGGRAIIVESENGPAACIIDCENDGRGFSFLGGETETSVVDGFTIINGRHDMGGGIHCSGSSPTIRNMVISQCHAMGLGGGLFLANASPEITGCVIDGCITESHGAGLYGLDASPVISGCAISDNVTPSEPYVASNGGGAMFVGDSFPIISDTNFLANDAWTYGGGVYCGEGTSLKITHCSFESNDGAAAGIYGTGMVQVEISDCTFTGNLGHAGNIELFTQTGLITDCLIHDNQGIGVQCYSEVLVTGNIITDNGSDGLRIGGQITVSGNLISGNDGAYHYGGGISCLSAGSVITGNVIENNRSSNGGGIYCSAESARIAGNLIIGNSADDWGGGIFTDEGCEASFINNLVIGNSSVNGGGIACFGSNPWFWNTTLAGNDAVSGGGGLFTTVYSHVRMINTIIWNNTAMFGSQVYVHDEDEPTRLTIRYSDVQGGKAGIAVDPGCALGWGEGMIDADPQFVTGPQGDHYLSQTASGQPETSPCVDGGDPSAGTVEGTTRTDEAPDSGVADMGFHYPFEPPGSPLEVYVLVGLGPGPSNPPRIRVFPPEDDATRIHAFQAYGSPNYGVNLGCGNVDGDPGFEVLTGPGPGEIFGPHVRGFEVDGTPVPGLSFLAYGTSKYGVIVTCGDLNGDRIDEIITGPGPGDIFGPHVRGWQYEGPSGVTPLSGVSFFAYGTPKWGVNVAAGDIDGDGYDEIVTGAGPGAVFGPHVRGWNVDGATATPISRISFFAYNTPRYGVRVSCGDIDGDGMAEIVTAPGPSPAFGSHIRGWNYDGGSLAAIPAVNFFAWPVAEAGYGASISAGTDLNGDGKDDIVVGAGPDPDIDTLVKGFSYYGSGVTNFFSLQAFPGGWTHGANVAAGRF